VLPYWPIDPWLAVNPWANFQLDLLRTIPAILPPALLWGASFPLALAALAGPGQDPARVSGRAYAANCLGAIAGALLFTLVFIPQAGTVRSQQILVIVSFLAAAVLFESWKHRFAGVVAVLLLTWTVSEIPWQAIAYGHRIAPTLRAVQLYPATATRPLYRGEGMTSSIVIAESDTGQRSYHVNGKTEATTALEDMRLQRMLGHVPALVHPNPRSVLSWGFGAGVTAGSFVVHPGIEKMVICELEPLAPAAATIYFGEKNYNVMKDPRTRVVYDDARHYLQGSKDTYDIITSDPLDPWAKGTATLYTREFFRAVKAHLNPGGIFGQFVQLYESNDEAVKSELATFFEAFPHATVWSNNINGQGYDLVLLGQKDPGPINVDELQSRLERADHARVAASLQEIGLNSAVELLGTYVGRASDFAAWLADAEINSDVNLRLQYIGGLGINAGAHENILAALLKARAFPEGLFIGESPRMQALRTILRARNSL
jgi:spermidine synthase